MAVIFPIFFSKS